MKGQPFFFDKNIFDEDAPSSPAEEEKAPIEFTRDDIAREKQKSFEEGKKAGRQEAEQGKTQSLLALLQKIEKNIKTLSSAETERNSIYETDAVHLSLCTLRKLFPVLNEKHGIDELKSGLEKALSSYSTPDSLYIELHENTASALQEHIKQLEENTQKTITVKTSSELQEQEFRISWPKGGIINNREKIAQKAFDLITEALAERGINVHHDDDTSNTEPDTDQDTSEPNSTGDL